MVVACVVAMAMWRSARPWTLMLDTGNVYLGQTVPAFRSWIAGRVPEWSDLLWGGFPLLADPTSAALYPPHLVSFLLSRSEPLRFFDVALALHVGLFAAGSATLLRTLGVGSAVVAFGGVLAALCPFAYFCGRTFFVVFGAQAWWPWAFAAAELLTRPATPCLGAAMVLGWVALAAQVLVGFPENAAYCAVVTSLWVLTRRSGLPLGARVGRVVLLGLGAAALAAPQLLPTLAFLPLSHRADRPGHAELASFWITDFSRLAVPGREGIDDAPAFLGLASLALLAIAVLARRPRAGFLFVLAGVSMVLSMGPQVGLYAWLQEIPPFGHFRSPVKLYAFTEFAVAWGAALGADALWRLGAGRARALAAILVLVVSAERGTYVALEYHARRTAPAPTPGLDVVELLARSVVSRPRDREPPRFVYDTAGLVGGEYAHSLGALVGLSSLRAGSVALITPAHLQLLDRRRPSTLLGAYYALIPREECEEAVRRLLWRKIEESRDFCILENPARPQHYSVIRRPLLVSSEAEMVRAARFRGDGPVPVVAPPEVAAGVGLGGAIVRSYEAGRAVLTVMSADRGLLLVRDSWLPGWTVRVDGVETTAYPAAGLYFAVPFRPGTHTVELRYRAPGFRAGVLVAAAWVVGAVACAIAGRRRSRYASP